MFQRDTSRFKYFSLDEVDDWSDDNKSPSEYYCVVGGDDVIMSSRRGSHEADNTSLCLGSSSQLHAPALL